MTGLHVCRHGIEDPPHFSITMITVPVRYHEQNDQRRKKKFDLNAENGLSPNSKRIIWAFHNVTDKNDHELHTLGPGIVCAQLMRSTNNS